MLMKFNSIIFNDSELDILLSGRKNIQNAKKALILYFFTFQASYNINKEIFI